MRVGDGKGGHCKVAGKFRREDVYGDFHIYLPSPLHNALKKICEEKDITITSVYTELLEGFLKDQMDQADYNSLMGFVNEYYPPYKSRKVVDFWERYLGLKDD